MASTRNRSPVSNACRNLALAAAALASAAPATGQQAPLVAPDASIDLSGQPGGVAMDLGGR